MNDFYVGYLPKAPDALRRFVRRLVFALGLLLAAAAVALVLAQMPFANSWFEFGKARELEGVLDAKPYPSLLVPRPGGSAEGEGYSRYLLVAPGKHGAEELVAGFDGARVRLRGTLAYREGGTIVELVPGSLVALQAGPELQLAMVDLGPVTMRGEIVDSKCYLGVMNPGRGKVHRACAARCLSGGSPPLFISDEGDEQFLLVNSDGSAIGRNALLEFVAEPLVVSGELLKKGPTRLLAIDTGSLRHLPSGRKETSPVGNGPN